MKYDSLSDWEYFEKEMEKDKKVMALKVTYDLTVISYTGASRPALVFLTPLLFT